jgi:hypothetical protein
VPFPTLVVTGAFLAQAGVNSATPIIPGVRIVGDLLIAHIEISTTGKTFGVGGGWTIPDSYNATFSACWAWRICDGTEANPTFTWAGPATVKAVVVQWRGVLGAPIGAFTKKSGTSTLASSNPIVTTSDNSVLHDILLTSVGAYNISGILNRTSIYNNGTTFATLSDYNVVNQSGSTTDTIAYAINNSNWIIFSIEIRGTSVGSPDQMLASQDVSTAVETYTLPVLAARASQIVQTSLESYEPPVLFAIVSQITVSALVPVAPPTQKVQVQIYD